MSCHHAPSKQDMKSTAKQEISYFHIHDKYILKVKKYLMDQISNTCLKVTQSQDYKKDLYPFLMKNKLQQTNGIKNVCVVNKKI